MHINKQLNFAMFCFVQKGNTALHIASLAGHLNIVKLLVDNGAKYDVQAHVSYHGNGLINNGSTKNSANLVWVEMYHISCGCDL